MTVIALNLGIVYVLKILLNLWQVNFYEVIQNYNYPGFIAAIGQYSFLALCLVIVRGYQICEDDASYPLAALDDPTIFIGLAGK